MTTSPAPPPEPPVAPDPEPVTIIRTAGNTFDRSTTAGIDPAAFDGSYTSATRTTIGEIGYFTLAARSGTLTGYAFAFPVNLDDGNPIPEPGNWYLNTVAVLPTKQHAGVGTALVVDLAAWLIRIATQISTCPLAGPLQPRREQCLRRLGFTAPGNHTFTSTPEHLIRTASAHPQTR